MNEGDAVVIAVVVTYNRRKLLVECLESVLRQTYRVKKIILVDNNSTDGTQDYLKQKGFLENKLIDYVLMSENTGGAGGFYEGIKRAGRHKCNWIWIMDDDTIPDPNCLAELMRFTDVKKISYLASNIYGLSGKPMNVPTIDNRLSSNGYMNWQSNLEKGLAGIRSATFVSILIRSDAVKECGLPCKNYFIWGDDSEYTLRLTQYYGPAYLVGSSRACHKRKDERALSIWSEKDKKRIANYYYMVRNGMVNSMIYNSGRKTAENFALHIYNSFKLLFSGKYGFMKAFIVWKGLIDSIFMQKRIKKYIMAQVNIWKNGGV